jgi:putative hydrolase of the HAD superfamily
LPTGHWIAFDLDDTLHYFKRSSGAAAEAVFRDIQEQLGIGVDQSAEAYRKILRSAQSGHFVATKTSHEYRGERFATLLSGFGVTPDPHLNRLLGIYDTTLGESLQLKPGASEALRTARQAGYSIMVVSEGPHDAQQTTIERLGIAPGIDLLVTSAGEGVSKCEGLFEEALKRADCEPREILFVGDSLERDIVPTSALGITNVYVGEDALPDGTKTMRLNLEELGRLFSSKRPWDG